MVNAHAPTVSVSAQVASGRAVVPADLAQRIHGEVLRNSKAALIGLCGENRHPPVDDR
jgi:hypothetical protein